MTFFYKISFVGFETQQIASFEVIDSKVDLGILKLVPSAKILDEVTGTAEAMTYSGGRRR